MKLYEVANKETEDIETTSECPSIGCFRCLAIPFALFRGDYAVSSDVTEFRVRLNEDNMW
jgi:hypothetical protein